MMSIQSILKWFRPSPTDIALVLSGGGARGYAHIGAIEELERQGYHIRAVSGTSMGALVGGFYCAGKLQQLKEIVTTYSTKEWIGLMDVDLGFNHIVGGNKLTDRLADLLEGVYIEDLSIPFSCVAADMNEGKEKVFSEGPLVEAIRASISIPGVFRPYDIDGHQYIDGTVFTPLPLQHVKRHKRDLLVAVDVNGRGIASEDDQPDMNQPASTTEADHTDKNLNIMKYLKGKLPFLRAKLADNYFNMTKQVAQLGIQNSTALLKQLYPPDICAELPMKSYNIFDFTKAEEICAAGTEAMRKALETYRGLR